MSSRRCYSRNSRFHLSLFPASPIMIVCPPTGGCRSMAVDNRKTGMRILLGVVVLLLGGGMLLYFVPQTPGTGEASSTDIVAKVGDQTVSAAEIRQQLSEVAQRNQVPKQLESLYARQILNQLIFQK